MTEGTKYAVWGLACGAAITAIVGFGWGGWVTGGSAEAMALRKAETAVVVSYVPVCVAKAQQSGTATLAAFKDANAWSRDEYVMQAGWADGAGDHRRAVARECATKTMEGMAAPNPAKPR